MYSEKQIKNFKVYKSRIDSMIATAENVAQRRTGTLLVFAFFKIDRLVRRRTYIHKILYDYLLYQDTDELVLSSFLGFFNKHEIAVREGRPSKYKNIMLRDYNELYSALLELNKMKKNKPKFHVRMMDKIWFVLNGMWGVSVD